MWIDTASCSFEVCSCTPDQSSVTFRHSCAFCLIIAPDLNEYLHTKGLYTLNSLTKNPFSSCSGTPFTLHQTLAHKNPGMYNASFESFWGSLTTRVCGANVSAHLLYDGQELGVFGLIGQWQLLQVELMLLSYQLLLWQPDLLGRARRGRGSHLFSVRSWCARVTNDGCDRWVWIGRCSISFLKVKSWPLLIIIRLMNLTSRLTIVTKMRFTLYQHHLSWIWISNCMYMSKEIVSARFVETYLKRVTSLAPKMLGRQKQEQ